MKRPDVVSITERHEGQGDDKLTRIDGAIVILLVSLGFQHKRIAALFDCNQGRISEVVNNTYRFIDE